MTAAADDMDDVIVGSGQAGPFLGVALAGDGRRVALVEARQVGGTCINRGCTPTKTLRKSARVAYMARRAAEFGVNVGPVEVDVKVAMARMTTRVEQARAGLEGWLGSTAGLEVVPGHGRLAGRDGERFVVTVGDRRLRAARVFLNTGTRPFVPAIPGLAAVRHLTSDDVLALDVAPAHLIVVGGSYIGLELGQIFRRFGSAVTVLEAGPRLVSREDPDVAAAITGLMTGEGVEVVVGAAITGVAAAPAHGPTGAQVTLADGRVITGSHLLIATGRVPNTDDLGLATIGLSPDARGYLATNGRLETEVAGVWALGDINRRGAFTHTSYHDHEVVLANLRGGDRSVDDRIPTYAMFTDPPLGHVGLYEADARRLVAGGRSVSQAVFSMANVSRAKEESEPIGLIKLLVDDADGRFLGATILGISADELIQTIGQLMAAGATWRTVRDALPVHPTVTEFLPTILDRLRPLEPA
ncbi:MAG: mercuric reductase [Kofleriaceae bacterium]